jgi:ribosomal protein S18 acetylase RimI-like enzyme
MGFTPEFQGFAAELQSLPGIYAAPAGRLLLAMTAGRSVGTVALRRLDDGRCEAKRLYVRPEYRGQGIAKALLARLVEEARAQGYQEMLGDTLISMQSALRLYEQFGFRQTDPYYSTPSTGIIYLKLPLA